jgi:hypothetical protein
MSSSVFSTFNAEVEKRHAEMIKDLESISVDDLKSQGLQISIGGKTYKFNDLEVVEEEDIEDKLRREFKEKLNIQQGRIREKINNKINQLLAMHKQKQQEMDRKEASMKRRYQDAAMMPDLTMTHFAKGLSVVKGSHNDELIWMFRGVYNPRFIVYYDESGYSSRTKHRKKLPSALLNRMKKDIVITITTKKEMITSIVTKYLSDEHGVKQLVDFPHYHHNTPGADCWGNWRYNKTWNTPDDIFNLAKDAESVLETINQGSIATRGPAGLPRLQTILNNVQNLPEASQEKRRKTNNEDEDVWSV